MKVICIENKDIDGSLNPLLTINKVYDVEIEEVVYIINKDYMFMDKFSYKHFFVPLQEWRDNQLKLIGI